MNVDVREIRINVRTSAEIKQDIEIVARLRGLNVSSLINYLAVKAIREEKELSPHSFHTDLHKRIAEDIGSPGVKATSIKVTKAEPKRKTG